MDATVRGAQWLEHVGISIHVIRDGNLQARGQIVLTSGSQTFDLRDVHPIDGVLTSELLDVERQGPAAPRRGLSDQKHIRIADQDRAVAHHGAKAALCRESASAALVCAFKHYAYSR